jgi:hypothetical protein
MNSVKTKHRLSQNFKECRIKPKQINERTHSIIQHPIPTRLYSSNVLMNPPRKPAPLQLPHKISLLPLQGNTRLRDQLTKSHGGSSSVCGLVKPEI